MKLTNDSHQVKSIVEILKFAGLARSPCAERMTGYDERMIVYKVAIVVSDRNCWPNFMTLFFNTRLVTSWSGSCLGIINIYYKNF